MPNYAGCTFFQEVGENYARIMPKRIMLAQSVKAHSKNKNKNKYRDRNRNRNNNNNNS